VRKNRSSEDMAYRGPERVFILEHHFASRSFAAVPEALTSECPDMNACPLEGGGQYRRLLQVRLLIFLRNKN
jgi:hypothetical protein